MERLRVPRRVATILEGESLLNDATALVTFQLAVGAVGGSFVLWKAGVQFVYVTVVGVAIGLAVAWLIVQVRLRLDNPAIETTVSLLSGFAAYIPASAVGASGVLAVLALGLYLGRRVPRIVSSQTRLQTQALWAVVVLLLNGLLFILVGLQLKPILASLRGDSIVDLVWRAALISLAVPLVIGHTTTPFPGRDLIVFLTFTVIMSTLVLQGLTLPWLINRLGVGDDGRADREESKARLKATRAAMSCIDELARSLDVAPDIVDDLREHYADNDRRFTACFHGSDDEIAAYERRAETYRRFRRALLDVERRTVVDLRNEGVINDEVMSRVQRDIDLEEVRQEG